MQDEQKEAANNLHNEFMKMDVRAGIWRDGKGKNIAWTGIY